MSVAVLAHYSRTLGHGVDWNMDEGAVYHAANEHGTATLCGYRSDAPRRGTSERGWEFWGTDPRFGVTCKRCLKILAHENQEEKYPPVRKHVSHASLKDLGIPKSKAQELLPHLLQSPEHIALWNSVFLEEAKIHLDACNLCECTSWQDLKPNDWSAVEAAVKSRVARTIEREAHSS